MVQIFLYVHAVPAAPIVVDLISFVFLPSLVCASEVTADVHLCVFCVSVFSVFLRVAYLYMQLSLFISPFGFVRCRFGASDDFVCDVFSCLEFLYLRFLLSYAVSISACFDLQCCSGLRLLV